MTEHTTVATREPEEVRRARSIVTGADVKPATGQWSFYKQYAWLPNYYGIETSDYTDSGFNITGYIHEKDARLIAAAPTMLEALHMILACTPHVRGDQIEFDCGDPFVLARAAIAKAEGETK